MQNEPTATRAQMRELDRLAIEQYGIPGIVLMENAGRHCAHAAAEMLGEAEGKRVAVLCGRGNNGGDGFVVARRLADWGAEVEVLLLAERETVLEAGGEAAANLRVLLSMGVPVRETVSPDDVRGAVADRADCDLIVDGLLGTGASGEVREPFLSAVEAVNATARPVLAIDVPSGLDCDTGEPLGCAIRASRTVTFAPSKVGFGRPGAEQYTGEVAVVDIGIPRAAVEAVLPSEE